MTLQAYLKDSQQTADQFAEKIGVGSAAVRKYMSGRRIPSKDVMTRIALATGCKVTANDFFGIAA